jgi:competence protein ComEC
MKLFQSPRQPLPGLALAAAGGIFIAEFFHAPIEYVCAGILLASIVSLIRPATWLTYFLVSAAFCALHLVQETEAPGKKLSERVSDRARTATVIGTVESDPKIAPNEFMTFLLRLDRIDLGGRQEPCGATVRVRWKGSPKPGDRLRLSGIVEEIPPPRNPGEFDLRAYLARRDVYNSVFVRYSEDGVVLQTGAGGFLSESAARARDWMRATLTADWTIHLMSRP